MAEKRAGSSEVAAGEKAITGVSCTICGDDLGTADLACSTTFPFCSSRCRQIDLGRWLGEAYRIPGMRPVDADEPTADDASLS